MSKVKKKVMPITGIEDQRVYKKMYRRNDETMSNPEWEVCATCGKTTDTGSPCIECR